MSYRRSFGWLLLAVFADSENIDLLIWSKSFLIVRPVVESIKRVIIGALSAKSREWSAFSRTYNILITNEKEYHTWFSINNLWNTNITNTTNHICMKNGPISVNLRCRKNIVIYLYFINIFFYFAYVETTFINDPPYARVNFGLSPCHPTGLLFLLLSQILLFFLFSISNSIL